MAIRISNVSALGFLVLFVVTSYGGAELVAFRGLSDRVDAATSEPAEQEHQRLDPSLESRVLTWTGIAGVEARARGVRLDLILYSAPDDPVALEQAIVDLAGASPTSAAAWQAVLDARLSRGAPMKEVLEAFRMSALTGSHEGYFMMQRAMFGLEHWSELPDGDRRTVTRDVLSTIGPAHRYEERYRKVLAKKSAAERGEIRSAFEASGFAATDDLAALGI